MPGKSPHPGQQQSGSRPPVLPAGADDIHPGLYRPDPVTSPLDANGRQGQGDTLRLALQAGSPRADRVFRIEPPPPSLLATELWRIEKVLDNHAAEARQRAELPQARTG
jgi:hypothetical protein